MARIPLVTRDQIAEKEQPAYDAFMLSRAGRPNIGPYSLLLHMPEMAQRLEALRTYIRDEASLPQRLHVCQSKHFGQLIVDSSPAIIKGSVRTIDRDSGFRQR